MARGEATLQASCKKIGAAAGLRQPLAASAAAGLLVRAVVFALVLVLVLVLVLILIFVLVTVFHVCASVFFICGRLSARLVCAADAKLCRRDIFVKCVEKRFFGLTLRRKAVIYGGRER